MRYSLTLPLTPVSNVFVFVLKTDITADVMLHCIWSNILPPAMPGPPGELIIREIKIPGECRQKSLTYEHVKKLVL